MDDPKCHSGPGSTGQPTDGVITWHPWKGTKLGGVITSNSSESMNDSDASNS